MPVNVSTALLPLTILVGVAVIEGEGNGFTVTVGEPTAFVKQVPAVTVAVYVVVTDGVTLALPLPLPYRVNEARPLLIFTTAPGVPPATDNVADEPLQIAAVPVTVATGTGLTVTVLVPVLTQPSFAAVTV